MELRQDIDLLDDVVDFVFRIFDIDDLDGYRLTGSLIDPVSTQPTRPHYVSSLALSSYSLKYSMGSSDGWVGAVFTPCRLFRNCLPLITSVSKILQSNGK